jgi:hypothetical protein
MISTKNPFPGMNPFLETNWHPVHTALIGLMWQVIGKQLPPDLLARPEQRLVIDELSPTSGYQADVGIIETWKEGVSPSWVPDAQTLGGITVAEPQILRVDDDIERWIEIRTTGGEVVTVIELISPTNKGPGWSGYKAKQRHCLETTASLVEIDLLRGGTSILPVPEDLLPRSKASTATQYYICCSRAWQPGTRELYTCPLRERLPAFRIPLRASDKDIVLDLQPLIDECYEVGRFYLGSFEEDPAPPFPPEDAAWVDERLRTAGLRS